MLLCGLLHMAVLAGHSGAGLTAAGLLPVSYTHLDVYKRQVQNGADAVYMGFGAFNARRSAKNFTDEEFASAVRYCHLRGVRVFLLSLIHI